MFEPLAAFAGYKLGQAQGSKNRGGGSTNAHYTPGGIRFDPAEIDRGFASALGRAPSESERAYFGRMLEGGFLDASEIGDFLQSHPEAQRRNLDRDAGAYEARLGANDSTILNKGADVLAGRFATQGRTGSSGYLAAFANAARDLSMARQERVTSFYGGGLQNIQQATLGRSQMLQGRADSRMAGRDARAQGMEDYYRQRDDFNSQMQDQSRRNLQGALTNAAIQLPISAAGAYLGGLGYAKGLGAAAGTGGGTLASNYRALDYSLGSGPGQNYFGDYNSPGVPYLRRPY